MLMRLLKSEKTILALLIVSITAILFKEVGQYDIHEHVFFVLVVLLLTALFMQYTED